MAYHDIRADRYCEGCTSDGSLILIPLSKWLEENYRTRNQINRLLRRRLVVAKKIRNRIYVAWNPRIPEEFRDY